jgi:hypothetical protein
MSECCQEILRLVNATGLLLDIGGFVLLFKFGLPPRLSESGHIALAADFDPQQKKKGILYRKLGYLALILIIFGFFLQLASNFPEVAPFCD